MSDDTVPVQPGTAQGGGAAPPTAAGATTAEAMVALRHAGANPILRCFPQGAILVFDHDLRYLSAGGAGLVHLGLSQEMLEGNTIFEAFEPKTIAVIEPLYRLALAGQESTYDASLGDEVHLVRLVPLYDDGGAVIAGMAVVQDVTTARRSGRALRRSEADFRSAFDHAPIGKAIIGLDSRYERVNQAWCDILGYTNEQLVGMNVNDVTHPDDVPAVGEALADLLSGSATTYAVEKRYLTASGAVVWAASSASLVRNEDGSPLHVISQIEGITTRKEQRKVLFDERRRLHAAQTVGQVGSWEMDPVTRDVTWSDTLFRLYGLDPDAFDGRAATSVSRIHPDDVAEVQAALDASVETGTSFSVRHRATRADNGQERWFIASGAPVIEEGRTVSIAGAVIDVTSEVRAAEELAQARDMAVEASRLKSAFLATMSHEIRTPMNAVIGMTAMLLETTLGTEQRELLEIVRTSGDALLVIINDILDFSKIEAGGLVLEQEPFDLRVCVEDSIDLLVVSSEAKGLELIGDLDNRLPPLVVGDATRLRQVLVNLLGNAVKFTARGQVVLAATSEDDSDGTIRLRVLVADTGIGIAPDRMDSLFESFVQGDASTTRLYGGTGLGLAISRRLVEAMGGQLTARSEPGLGSTFSFSILVGRARAVTPPPAPQPPDGRSALVVDDNQTYRRVLRGQLEHWGWQVQEAPSGAAALALVASGATFDAALVDLDMPTMSGEQLAVQLRRSPATAQLPIILLGRHGPRAQVTGRGLFSATLSKPVRRARLHERLYATLPTGGTPPAANPATGARRGPWRVLLAEDNMANQKLGRIMLEKLGHRVDVVGNGREAVRAVGLVPYDAVFMDLEMPEMDGLEATDTIRNEGAADHQPRIVALTASALDETKAVCLAAGMDDYLTKPLRLQDLADVIDRVTART
jgi:PAS domain S-box-containing protein